MSDPLEQDPAPHSDPAAAPATVTPSLALADGEWHRLHPATPLLRGGIALIAIIGIIVANLRERLIDMAVGAPGYEGDPVDWLLDNGLVPAALGVTALVLLIFVGIFYLSWRMSSFRITDETVEVRSGLLFRTNRRARLDRIQGINIVRPFFARLFGAARLEITVAGHDANVRLDYLGSLHADSLRLEILRRASGTAQAAAGVVAPGGTVIEQRVSELLAPELDPALTNPESVVTMHPGRLVGSTVLSSGFLAFVLLLIGGIVAVALSREFIALFTLFPALFGLGSFVINRIVKSLRYSIAATPDGVRVGYGLFTTSNETLPPGRIHSIEVRQSLFWRPADWWEVRVNRASQSSAQGAAGQRNTTILPVGTRADAIRVLELVLPGLVADDTRALVAAGLEKANADDGFTNSPRRAAVTHLFSWRRNGFALHQDALVLRRGAIWRELVIVPTARMQSVALHQGLLGRALRLASVQAHTVSGPISARLDGVDAQVATGFFRDVAAAAIASAQADGTHRWRAGEAPA